MLTRLAGVAAMALIAVTAIGSAGNSDQSQTSGPDGTPDTAIVAASDLTPNHLSFFAEQRYQIRGKVRLGLFSISQDDIGTGRMTWRSDGGTTTLTLLAGSDPQRAPRHVNQWGYVREEVGLDRATIFALRSAGAANPVFQAASRVDRGSFSASCSSIRATEVANAATVVNGHDLTYRMIERLLDHIESSRDWNERRAVRPSGTDAGFLTAMLRLLKSEGREAGSKRYPSVAYLYNGKTYDLSMHDSERIERARVGRRTFDQLIRADFWIHNRDTKEVTRFAVTYVPNRDHVVLPVQIIYEPSFWLSVELRLDDNADAPSDPAASEPVLLRIRSICDGVAR